MSEKKTMSKNDLEVIDELCVKIMAKLNASHHYLDAIAVTETTRETAMVRTKIDEALLWLRKYQDIVDDKLEELNPHRV